LEEKEMTPKNPKPSAPSPTPAISVRPVRPSDLPAIHALIGGVFEEYGCTLNLAEDTYLLDPGRYFREHGGEFWVVEESGAIIATIAMVSHDDAGELKCLYVHPSKRRQGLGRRLSEFAIDRIKQAGMERVVLWSDTRFDGAHRLYREMGFEQQGRRELHDSNNTVEYGFSITLDPPAPGE
jgi:N-acetylglutamate synthase-like GNAT family acetyltransferase